MKDNQSSSTRYIAFEGERCIAHGSPAEVAASAKEVVDRGDHGPLLIFDATTSAPIELDLRGTAQEVQERLRAAEEEPVAAAPPLRRRGPGRPKLGVVSKEVTLLPRHWAWLAEQPGGASVTLRKLVEGARRAQPDRQRLRRAQDRAYRFLSAMAGNLAGFEEATRALFAAQPERFADETEGWPEGIRDHGRRLAEAVFAESPKKDDAD